MPHDTTSTNSIKHWNRPLTWVRAAIDTLTRRLFAAGDAKARQHGWQVTSTQHGFGREYRDPRFDTLTPCPGCRGRGVQISGIECQRCRGSGRLVIKPKDQPSSDLPPRGLT